MSRLDRNTEGYFDVLFNLGNIPEKTSDGQFYYQVIDCDRVILLHKDHPLIKMTDEEFAACFDDPFYDVMTEVIYNAAMG